MRFARRPGRRSPGRSDAWAWRRAHALRLHTVCTARASVARSARPRALRSHSLGHAPGSHGREPAERLRAWRPERHERSSSGPRCTIASLL